MAALPRGSPRALSVFGPDGLVGTLYPTDPLGFVYADAWLHWPGASPLHPSIPLAAGAIDSPYVAAFFENLLPEGEQRRLISLRELATSEQPAVDRLQLLRWLFFNLCAGNNDSHAKNLSMVATAGGLRLAPFYDLMCTRVYAGLGTHFAFTLAGESEPGKLGPTHVTTLAKELRVAPRYLQGVAVDMAEKVKIAIPAAAAEILPGLAPGDRILTERLVQKIASLSNKMQNRLVHIL